MFRSLLLAGFVLLVWGQVAEAQSQSYGKWTRAADGRHYVPYYYKSTPTATAFKKQYVFHDPKDPHWVYWSNPANNPDNKSGKDSYWARCPDGNHAAIRASLRSGRRRRQHDRRRSRSPDKRRELGRKTHVPKTAVHPEGTA